MQAPRHVCLNVYIGVIAYVDVRSGTNSSINTSQAISDSLLDLGATVSDVWGYGGGCKSMIYLSDLKHNGGFNQHISIYKC